MKTKRQLGAAALLACLVSCGDAPELGLGEEHVQDNEAEIADRMYRSIEAVMRRRSAESGAPPRRFNQAKNLGCFDAQFFVGDLPDKLAQGLFAEPASYPAHIRFASASKDDDRDKDLYGASVRVDGVEGSAVLAAGERQDFLFNSHPALFAADPEEFLAFVEAVEKDRLIGYFLNPLDPHLGSLRILLKARSNPGNPYAIPYFSTTPFRHGPDTGTAVKHKLQPCAGTAASGVAGETGEHHLSEAMAGHLNRADACFDFMVQFQTDARRMPIEDASVAWPEELSPFQKVATIRISQQVFRDDESMQQCEKLSFNPWNALPAHRPLGGINRVRNSIYARAAEYRSRANPDWQ